MTNDSLGRLDIQREAVPSFYGSGEEPTDRHSGAMRKHRARNPYSRSWLWIPGSR